MNGEKNITNWKVLLCPSLHTLEGPCREILFACPSDSARLVSLGFKAFQQKQQKKPEFLLLPRAVSFSG